MIYKEKPKNFSPRFEVVSCYVECEGKILFLHRPDHKSQGGRWGLPAGKVEPNETQIQALLREVREETTIDLIEVECNFLKSIYVRHSDYDFVYHMYKVSLGSIPEVKINPVEHKNYLWEAPLDAITTLELVTDLDECIKMHY